MQWLFKGYVLSWSKRLYNYYDSLLVLITSAPSKMVINILLSNTNTRWQQQFSNGSYLADPFNFKHPDDWPHWKRRSQQFWVASALTEDSAAKQISLSWQRSRISIEFNQCYRRRPKCPSSMSFFIKVIFERARFNCRAQLEGETMEQYNIMQLYQLAENGE